MKLPIGEFEARLEAIVKEQVEAVGRLRDEFHAKLNALFDEAKGDAADLTSAHLAVFDAQMDRMNKLIEEV